jgi:hypothetical protein
MALARKALNLLALNPDIAVVQECSKNSVDNLHGHGFNGLWFGAKPHRLPVRYWGRLERDDVGRLETHQRLGKWQCQRKDSLICKVLD